jgi:hypothetical protein
MMLTDIVFPLISVAFAVAASFYSLRRSCLPFIDQPSGPSIVDTPELHILTHQVAIDKLGEPNKIAGWCAIVAAIFSAITPIWILVHRLAS